MHTHVHSQGDEEEDRYSAARSSAERDLTISTTKQIEVLWNGQVRED